MSQNISVAINTFNEEKNIARALDSVKWANEIIICDMHSEDKTVEIAKKHGARIFFYRREDYVEPARNFAISKASNDWILILDADEEIPASLSARLKQIASKMKQIMYVRIPRKNIIFNKWIKNSGWWPDYNVRFFKKRSVKWTDSIHSPPQTSGEGLDLEADEKWAITHYNYQSISQFIERMNSYTAIEAKQLSAKGYKFDWKDLFDKPLSEFLSRFFAGKGYQDGLHGLALSFLQAFSFLIVYLKLWESNKFKEQDIDLGEFKSQKDKAVKAIDFWIKKSKQPGDLFKRLFKKIKN